MKYRHIGKSGLAVSTVALGTMTFGEKRWGTDTDQSVRILDQFVEAGGNLIDTADKYNNGRSEEIIGRWLSYQNRNQLIVATKCFFPTQDNSHGHGLSSKHILKGCEASLRRLNTDYIDLYQLHAPDPQTPIEETLNALNKLLEQGKIRSAGFCNFPSWTLVDAFHAANNSSIPPLITGQYLYNLLQRDIEHEIVPACKRCNTGILCWSPLSGGMLTGKYTNPDEPVEGSRLAIRSELSDTRYKLWYKNSSPVVEELERIALEHQTTCTEVALAWLLKRPQVTSVIVGARTGKQVLTNCRAADWELPQEDFIKLNSISQSPLPYPAKWISEQATFSN